MIPGMNPKQIEQAMKRLGIKQQAIEAEEVIIKRRDGDLIIRNPEIMKINMGGQESLQITGKIEELSTIKEEDVETVAEQASVSKEEARKALEKCSGYLAEAILSLKEG